MILKFFIKACVLYFKIPYFIPIVLLFFTAQLLLSNEYGIGLDGTGYVKGYEPSNTRSQEPDYSLPPDYEYFIEPYADLQYADFTSVDLSDADLTGANLSYANLQNTNLNRATLVNAQLKNSDLAATRFNEANLRGANLSGAWIFSTSFTDADMTGANLSNTDNQVPNFTNAKLRRVDFSGASLYLPFFLVTDLSGSNFSNADLSNAQLQGTIWTNVKSLDEYDLLVSERDTLLGERDAAIVERNVAITERDARPTQAAYDLLVSERDTLLGERDAAIVERNAAIAERDARPTQAVYQEVVAERDSRLSHEDVMDLRPGSSLISVNNGFANLTINIEESTDLENWHIGNTANYEIPVQDNEPTKFFRVVAASVVSDSDGDGLIDSFDAFPDDPNETEDSDGDGVGDNADAFPNDSLELAALGSIDFQPKENVGWIEVSIATYSNGQKMPGIWHPIADDLAIWFAFDGSWSYESNYFWDRENQTSTGPTGNVGQWVHYSTVNPNLYTCRFNWSNGTTGYGFTYDGRIDLDNNGIQDRIQIRSGLKFPAEGSQINFNEILNSLSDNLDLFNLPINFTENDYDGDGVDDDLDAFPEDPYETADSDGDGIGDNADAFPNDPGNSNLTSNLIANYPFSGDFFDSSSNEFDAINHGVDFAPDLYGNPNLALYFDGTSYLDIPDALFNPDIEEFSYTFLINPLSFETVGNRQIIYKGSNNGEVWCYQVGGRIAFAVKWNDWSSHTIFADLNYSNSWNHVVVNYKKGAFMQIFIDGILQTESNIPDKILWKDQSGAYPSSIGSYRRGSGEFFIGYLDEIRIYNAVISPAEAQAFYDSYNLPASDLDNDGIPDSIDPDDDNDGLLDVIETNTGIWVDVKDTGTDPQNADSDGDGLSDSEELSFFSSPYEIVYGSYTYSEALLDAVDRGGFVARTRGLDEFANLNRYLNTLSLDEIASYSIARSGLPSGAQRLWFSANYSDAQDRWEWHSRPPDPLHNGEEPGHTLIWDLGYDEWLDVGDQTAVILEHVSMREDGSLPLGVSKLEFPYDWFWDSQFSTCKYSYVLERDTERLILEGKNTDPNNSDTDEDGVEDDLDAFPNNSSETNDSDGDGVGDNADAFPNDSSKSSDDYGDGLVSYYDFSGLAPLQGSGSDLILFNNAQIINDPLMGEVLRIETNENEAGNYYGNVSDTPGGYALISGALDNINNNGNTDFSFSIFFKLEETHVHPGGSIVNHGVNGSNYEKGLIGYRELDGVNDKMHLFTQVDDYNYLGELDSFMNSWVHYVMTVESNSVKLYINGNEILEYPGGNYWDSLMSVGEQLLLGKSVWDHAASTRITACFDEMKVYNRAIKAHEVSILFEEVFQSNLSTGLVAHYQFSNGFGDSSNLRQDAEATNVTLASDGSAYFSGNSFMDLSFSMADYASATFSTWMKAEDLSGIQGIISQPRSSIGTGFALSVDGSDQSQPKLNVSYLNDSFSIFESVYADFDSSLVSDWVHLASTIDGSNSKMIKLYLNGSLIATEPIVQSNGVSNVNMLIGKELHQEHWSHNGLRYFKGHLDEVRIYDRPLSGGEIEFLARSIDSDADGVTDYDELTLHGTDPNNDGSQYYNYLLGSEGVTITGYTGTESTLLIPSKIEGKPVIEIGYGAFSWRSDITKVILPSTLKIIDDQAFRECISLEVVVLSNGLERIGDTAFGKCASLATIKIPESVIEIEPYAFSRCYSLESIVIPQNVNIMGRSIFFDCTNLVRADFYNDISEIPEYTFENCSNLEFLRIFSDMSVDLNSNAFLGCDSIISIVHAIDSDFDGVVDSI